MVMQHMNIAACKAAHTKMSFVNVTEKVEPALHAYLLQGCFEMLHRAVRLIHALTVKAVYSRHKDQCI